jgi:hypothetical protein
MRSVLPFLLFVLSSTAACGDLRDAYGKEHVLYDSRRDAAATRTTGSPAQAPAQAPEFARILLLEQTHSEIERALALGLDSDGALARKLRAVDDELQARLARVKDQLPAWRAARAEELRQFVTR